MSDVRATGGAEPALGLLESKEGAASGDQR